MSANEIPVCPPRPRREELSPGRWVYRAPAKINLTLRVGPRRSDGYHPLDSLVAKVTLYDELILEPTSDARLEFACDSCEAGAPEKNLALRAAQAMQEVTPARGARITLIKNIPVGAGLGGGSSDAACVLAALNELWAANLPSEELSAMAAALGSDVPLFLGPPASRISGRGEEIAPASIRSFAAILASPPVHSSTAAVYLAYDDMSPAPLAGADLSAFEKLPPSQWDALLRNDLYAPAGRACPAIVEWANRLSDQLGRAVHMTGSGSSLFVLFDGIEQAKAAGRKLRPEMAAISRIVTSLL